MGCESRRKGGGQCKVLAQKSDPVNIPLAMQAN